MELKYLKTIKTILEEGSFLKAAQKLDYTQSTITFQVQQTEQELQVKLFEKIGRRMQLTQAGRDLLPVINTILAASDQLAAYSMNEGEMSGVLDVAMPETLLSYKMQPVIKAFHEQAPAVRLSIQALNCYEICDRLQSGAVDLGVHYDVGGYGSAINVHPLFAFPLTLAAAPRQKELWCGLSDIAQHELTVIYSDRSSIYQQHFEHMIEESSIPIKYRMELTSTEAIKKCVESNLGITVLPRFALEDELQRQSLVQLSGSARLPLVSAVYSYHKNKWLSPAMKLFIKLMEDLLSEHQHSGK